MLRRTVLAAAAVLVLGACSGGGEPPAKSPAQVLADAKARFARAGTVHLRLTSSEVPRGVNGVTGADGSGVIDATTPRFAGKVTATVTGITGIVDVVAIGEDVWMKLFTPTFEKADLAGLGAPNPSALLHPDTGLGSFLGDTRSPRAGGQSRAGNDVVTTYSGTLPSTTVHRLLLLGDGAPDFAVTYGITDTGELRTAVLTGQFYKGTTSTYRLTLSDFGAPVDVKSP